MWNPVVPPSPLPPPSDAIATATTTESPSLAFSLPVSSTLYLRLPKHQAPQTAMHMTPEAQADMLAEATAGTDPPPKQPIVDATHQPSAAPSSSTAPDTTTTTGPSILSPSESQALALAHAQWQAAQPAAPADGPGLIQNEHNPPLQPQLAHEQHLVPDVSRGGRGMRGRARRRVGLI